VAKQGIERITREGKQQLAGEGKEEEEGGWGLNYIVVGVRVHRLSSLIGAAAGGQVAMETPRQKYY